MLTVVQSRDIILKIATYSDTSIHTLFLVGWVEPSISQFTTTTKSA